MARIWKAQFLPNWSRHPMINHVRETRKPRCLYLPDPVAVDGGAFVSGPPIAGPWPWNRHSEMRLSPHIGYGKICKPWIRVFFAWSPLQNACEHCQQSRVAALAHPWSEQAYLLQALPSQSAAPADGNDLLEPMSAHQIRQNESLSASKWLPKQRRHNLCIRAPMDQIAPV